MITSAYLDSFKTTLGKDVPKPNTFNINKEKRYPVGGSSSSNNLHIKPESKIAY